MEDANCVLWALISCDIIYYIVTSLPKKQIRHSLKRVSSPYKREQGKIMKNLKIIQKMAIFFAVASTIFVVLSAIDTYYLIQLTSPDAPIEYVTLAILSNVLPYLFIAVLSLVIAAISRGVGKESLEKEAPAPTKPEEELPD